MTALSAKINLIKMSNRLTQTFFIALKSDTSKLLSLLCVIVKTYKEN